MKKSVIFASSLALVASLSACEKQTDAPTPAKTASTSSGNMSTMPMPSETKHGSGTGKVVAVDATTGAISIEHGPIKQLEWPGMTMGFSAKPDMLKTITKGDMVSFEIDWDGKAGTITAISKQ